MYPTRSLDSSHLDHDTDPQLGVLSFKRLDPGAVLPTRGSSQAAGLDIYALADLSIQPGERVLARTGLAVAIPEGYYGRLAPRSGLATRHGLATLAGVIDADYRGELLCLLQNTGAEPVILPAQSKICQLLIEKIITPTAVWADEISETDRGSGGFGSTG
jgi:dUTP diphosphatase